MSRRAHRTLTPWPAVVVALVLTGCERDTTGPVTAPQPALPVTLTAALHNSFIPEVLSQDCKAAEDVEPDTPLFYIPLYAWTRECSPTSPLTAPDGHQLTAGEWVQATGRVTISCVDEGTRYDFQFQGLVPGGTYSIWHRPPPPHASYGALASHPGEVRNVFTAMAFGTADFSVTGTAGPMTVNGFVPACLLPLPTQAQLGDRWQVFWVVYHQNGSAGSNERPPEDAVDHLVFEVE